MFSCGVILRWFITSVDVLEIRCGAFPEGRFLGVTEAVETMIAEVNKNSEWDLLAPQRQKTQLSENFTLFFWHMFLRQTEPVSWLSEAKKAFSPMRREKAGIVRTRYQ